MKRYGEGESGVRFSGSLVGLLTSLLFLLPASAAVAAPGDLDGNFSRDGLTRLPSGLIDVADLDVGPDGSAVVVGTTGEAPAGDVMVVRFRPDGELDPAFGQAGVVTFDSGAYDAGLAVLIEPSGSTLVGGSAGPGFLLLRLGPDGELAPSLDGDGVIIRPELRAVQSIAAASGERIVLGSGVRTDNEVTAAAVRLLADGTPDPRFGTDGVSLIDRELAPLPYLGAHLVAVQPDDSVLVGADSAVVRLGPTGQLVSGFGQSGAIQVGSVAEARSVALRPSGEILVGVTNGEDLVSHNSAFSWTLRVSPDGQSAFAFAVNRGTEIALAPEGDLLVAGGSPGGDLPRTLTIMRLRPSLKPDRSFGRRGRAPAYLGLRGTYGAGAMAVGPDGKVLASAALPQGGLVLARFAVARGRADADADGISDGRDRCRYGHATNRSGCIRVARSLGLKRRKRNLMIDLEARTNACILAARVRLFVKRPGADRRVASQRVEATHHQHEVFYSAPAGSARSYYATAPASDTAIAHCRRAKSRTVRIPGR